MQKASQDNRSNQMNPNNAAYKSEDNDNRSNQMNLNNPIYSTSRPAASCGN